MVGLREHYNHQKKQVKGRRDHSIFKDLVNGVLNDLEKAAAIEEAKKQAKEEAEAAAKSKGWFSK